MVRPAANGKRLSVFRLSRTAASPARYAIAPRMPRCDGAEVAERCGGRGGEGEEGWCLPSECAASSQWTCYQLQSRRRDQQPINLYAPPFPFVAVLVLFLLCWLFEMVAALIAGGRRQTCRRCSSLTMKIRRATREKEAESTCLH